MRRRGRRRDQLTITVLCIVVCYAPMVWGGPQVDEVMECRQMGIIVRQQTPGRPGPTLRRSTWLCYLREVLGYRWTSIDQGTSLLPRPTTFIAGATRSQGFDPWRLAPRGDLIGFDQGVAALAWVCGVDASVASRWLTPPADGKTGRHSRWLRASDGCAMLLAALRNTPTPVTADPVDAVRRFYAALGRVVASPSRTGIQQLQLWCCGDAFMRLASNLTVLGADNAFCLVQMRVVATTRQGHLATVSVVRTADQRVAGSTSRSTVEDQFHLRYTNHGWRIYK